MPRGNIIVKDPDILGGTPVFRGTNVPFQALLDYLEGGDTLDEFLDDFPTVSKDAAVAAIGIPTEFGPQCASALGPARSILTTPRNSRSRQK